MDTGNSQQAQAAAPLTQDPQSSAPQLFQQSGNLQSVSTPQLLDNTNARITVPVNPADPVVSTTAAQSSGNWLVPTGLMLVLFVVVILILRMRKSVPLQAEYESQSLPIDSPQAAIITNETPEVVRKKPKQTKSRQKKHSKR